MSAILRITASMLPFIAAIVLGWNWLTDGLAQGAHYLMLGWFASLMGAFSVVMASGVLLPGAVGSIAIATLLRLRPPAVAHELAGRWLTFFFGPGLFLMCSWGTWEFMWRSHTPVVTEFALYGASYFWTAGLIVGSLALGTGGLVSQIVLRNAAQAATDSSTA